MDFCASQAAFAADFCASQAAFAAAYPASFAALAASQTGSLPRRRYNCRKILGMQARDRKSRRIDLQVAVLAGVQSPVGVQSLVGVQSRVDVQSRVGVQSIAEPSGVGIFAENVSFGIGPEPSRHG